MSDHPLTTYRAAHNLSLAELAERIGVTPATIFRWENGTRTPKPAYLAALNKLTAIPLSVLMGLEETPKPKGRKHHGTTEGRKKQKNA